MNLSSQVVSLELAKRLKELGVKQESWLKWVDFQMERGIELSNSSNDERDVAAFTVAELGNIISRAKSKDVMKAYEHVWNVPDASYITELGLVSSMRDPDIGAAMLIYLLENKLITA